MSILKILSSRMITFYFNNRIEKETFLFLKGERKNSSRSSNFHTSGPHFWKQVKNTHKLVMDTLNKVWLNFVVSVFQFHFGPIYNFSRTYWHKYTDSHHPSFSCQGIKKHIFWNCLALSDRKSILLIRKKIKSSRRRLLSKIIIVRICRSYVWKRKQSL